MATDAATFPIAREGRRDKSINPVNPGLQNKGNDNHGEPMTKGEIAEIADLRDTVHNISTAVMLLTKLQERPANGSSKWTGWIQTGVVCGMLLVSGTNAFKSSESDLRRDIAVLTEKLSQSEDRQKERERVADRERALLGEQNRQISIQLEARGIRIPKQ